ncbi:MAG: hypothetical protein JXR96_00170 [Deltaproteobacteria bacterium]|nr:hypothetical protein [Deltaproteobacteria bacterium]
MARRFSVQAFLFLNFAWLMSSSSALAWNQDQHRLIVSDTVDYMENNGDTSMKMVAEWLKWAPGYNHLLRGPQELWVVVPECAEGYTALCALRDEAANTDWYRDMFIVIKLEQAIEYCAAIIPPTVEDLPWYIRHRLACDYLSVFTEPGFFYTVEGIIPVLLDEFEGLPEPGSYSYGEFDLTSLNHLVGAYYESDMVDRVAGCQEREPVENLGYVFKNDVLSSCDSDSEGDCAWENTHMFVLGVIGQFCGDFIKVCPAMAGTMYDGITCHYHGLSGHSALGLGVRWLPVDSVGEYGMWAFKNSEDPDLLMLGRTLHASADAFEPHHNYLYLGRAHATFESWADDFSNITKIDQINRHEVGEYGFYNRLIVDYYLNRWDDAFDIDESAEYIIAEPAMRAAPFHHVSRYHDPEDEENIIEEIDDQITFARAVKWQSNNQDARKAYANDYGWLKTGEMGHNLSIAGNYTLLKKAFRDYYQRWENAGYCQDLHESNMEDWYRATPGPRVGSSPSQMNYGWPYVYFDEGTTNETLHPYYNDTERHWTNHSVISVTHTPLPAAEIWTRWLEIELSSNIDWHNESEGDHLVLRAKYFDFYTEKVGPWEDEFKVLNPSEAIGETFVFETKPNRRLAGVEVELVQGHTSDQVFVGGENGEIYIFSDNEWSPAMDTGTDDLVKGLWAAGHDDIFAATARPFVQGRVLHYDGNPELDWSAMPVPSNQGLEAIWGFSPTDIYAVGDFWGFILHYDGSEWSLMQAYAGEYTGLHGIWGSSPNDVFSVGAMGHIYHYDGEEWSEVAWNSDYLLHDVWGRAYDDIYAVGTGGTVLHFDGYTWTALSKKTFDDLHAVWGTDEELFIAGDYGMILHLDETGWSTMDTGATETLRDVWGSGNDHVVAVGDDETVLTYDGEEWSRIRGGPGCEVDFHAVWGVMGNCSPDRKLGFRIKKLRAELVEEEAAGGGDVAFVDAAIVDWIFDMIHGGGLFSTIGIIWECLPGMSCEDELVGNLWDAFGPMLDGQEIMDMATVFDAVHEALSETFGVDATSPALSAAALVRAAEQIHPGSMLESGLIDKAISWSLLRQGLGGKRSKATVTRVIEVDFEQPMVGHRRTRWNPDGTILPGMSVSDMEGYPGFREATEAELADLDSALDYLQLRHDFEKNYRMDRLLQLTQDNAAGIVALLETDAGGKPDVEARIEMLSEMYGHWLEHAEWLRPRVIDTDGDGLRDVDDLCPGECARGMDVNANGCIDRACGLWWETWTAKMWWVPRMVLSTIAHLACTYERLQRWRAAAGMLRSYDRMLRAYARVGWVAKEEAERLGQFATNARDADRGIFERLVCP